MKSIKIILASSLLLTKIAFASNLEDCKKQVDEVTQWPTEDRDEAAKNLCKLIDEKDAARKLFDASLFELLAERGQNTKFDLVSAISKAESARVACVDFNSELIYPHNIALLTAPLEIEIECFKSTEKLVRTQIYGSESPLQKLAQCKTSQFKVQILGEKSDPSFYPVYVAYDVKKSNRVPSLILRQGSLNHDVFSFENPFDSTYNYSLSLDKKGNAAQLKVVHSGVTILQENCKK